MASLLPSKGGGGGFNLKPPPGEMKSLHKDVRDYSKAARKGTSVSGDSFTGKGCSVCSLSVTGVMKNNVAVVTNKRRLLIVGSSITSEEYQTRRLFTGKSGNIIREEISAVVLQAEAGAPVDWISRNVTYTKAVRCAGNASVAEAHACWKYLEQDIAAVDPDVILVMGGIDFNIIMTQTWANESVDSTLHHGMVFPLRLAGRSRLVVTTVDPIDALKERNKGKGRDANEQTSEMFFFRDDIRIAAQLVVEGVTPPNVDWRRYLFPFHSDYTPTVVQVAEGVTIKGERLLMVENVDNGYDLAKQWIDRMLSTGIPSTEIGFDIEATGLKPYDSLMLSYAISDGYYTVSVLVDHYSVRHLRDRVARSIELLRYFLLSDVDYVLCAHNLLFEMEWMFYFFGGAVARKRKKEVDQSKFFACTMAGKWRVAPDRHNRHMSLDAVTCQSFGFDLKAMYEVDRTKMELYQPQLLLEYNAGDAIVVPYIVREQRYVMKHVLQNVDPYIISIGGILSYSIMAGHGIPVNLRAAKALADPFRKELEELELDIANTTTYKDFAAAKGRPPVWQSSDDMAYILYEMYEMPKVFNKKTGQLSTDKHVIAQYEEQLPDLQLVVQYKEMKRFLDVTVSALVHGRSASGETVTYRDGMIHPFIRAFSIPTDRTATTPNIQNGSKRNKRFKKARDVYGVDPDEEV